MNKIFLFGAAACLLIAFNSCKPKQSTYKAAYEQAQQRSDSTLDEDFSDDFSDEATDDLGTSDTAPVSKPATGSIDDSSTGNYNTMGDVNESLNYATRQEQINPYPYEDSGYNAYAGFQSLKRFNVVIGSFRNRTNASALRERMQYEGYSANMVDNGAGMIRVIVGSSDSKSEAVRLRDSFRSKHYPGFQDAWILEQRY